RARHGASGYGQESGRTEVASALRRGAGGVNLRAPRIDDQGLWDGPELGPASGSLIPWLTSTAIRRPHRPAPAGIVVIPRRPLPRMLRARGPGYFGRIAKSEQLLAEFKLPSGLNVGTAQTAPGKGVEVRFITPSWAESRQMQPSLGWSKSRSLGIALC